MAFSENRGRARGKVPDRWLDYSHVGRQIPGTPFVAFKVPLKETICSRLPPEKRFDPQMVFQLIPHLGMVVDLTATNKYYDPNIFERKHIRHKKLLCPGHVIPPNNLLKQFFLAVDEFSLNNESNRLIGVHCTHGLNRTGFFICCYMIQKMGFDPEDAIRIFNDARGHPMERANYLKALRDFRPNQISFGLESSISPAARTINNTRNVSDESRRTVGGTSRGNLMERRYYGADSYENVDCFRNGGWEDHHRYVDTYSWDGENDYYFY